MACIHSKNVLLPVHGGACFCLRAPRLTTLLTFKYHHITSNCGWSKQYTNTVDRRSPCTNLHLQLYTLQQLSVALRCSPCSLLCADPDGVSPLLPANVSVPISPRNKPCITPLVIASKLCLSNCIDVVSPPPDAGGNVPSPGRSSKG